MRAAALNYKDMMAIMNLTLVPREQAPETFIAWARETYMRAQSGEAWDIPNPLDYLAQAEKPDASVDPLKFTKNWLMASRPERQGRATQDLCGMGSHSMRLGDPLWVIRVIRRDTDKHGQVWGCEHCAYVARDYYQENGGK